MLVIDLLKIFAVVAVILIHTFSAYRFSPLFFGDTTYLTIGDQIMRFSVPLFVALSGYGLMIGYGQKKFEIKKFFVRRILQLLPWYLFFATVIIFFVTYVFFENTALYGNIKLWRLYVFGQADYHLYFVPMIIQLYLFFPVLLFLFRRLPAWLIVLAAFLWQIFWYYLIGQKTEVITNNNGLWPDQVQYRNAFTWLFYFILGMFLAKRSFRRILPIALAVTITGGFFMVLNSLDLLAAKMNVIVATRFTRHSVLIYATGVILLGKYLIDRFVQPTRWQLGNLSYIVYLLHTLVLRAIFRLPEFVFSTGLAVTVFVVVGASFLLAGIIRKVSRQ